MRPIARLAMVASLALLVADGARAQSGTGTSPRSSAPIGHRQPEVRDLPPAVQDNEGSISPKAKELDEKLNICRGC